MSSDSEEDYMSMDFTSAVENDVRPGLLQTNRQKREFELLKRKQEFDVKSKQCKKKDLKVLEEEHREEGLNKPIEEGNKGFALLAKMGYKAGGGIGKQDKPTALIDIKIKTSRKGLGLEEQRPRRKHSSTLAQRIPRPDQLSIDRLSDYRQQLSERLGEKKLEGDLRRAQKICVEFDRNIGVDEPGQWWFWPPDELDTNNEEELEALSTRNNEENESEDDEYIKQVDILVETDKNDTSCKPDESCTSRINENERRKDDQRHDKTNDLNKYIELVGNLVRKEHKEVSKLDKSVEEKGNQNLVRKEHNEISELDKSVEEKDIQNLVRKEHKEISKLDKSVVEKDNRQSVRPRTTSIDNRNDLEKYIALVGNLVNSGEKDTHQSYPSNVEAISDGTQINMSNERTIKHKLNLVDSFENKPLVNCDGLKSPVDVSDDTRNQNETTEHIKTKPDSSRDNEGTSVNTNQDWTKKTDATSCESKKDETLNERNEEEEEEDDEEDYMQDDTSLSTQDKLFALLEYLRSSHLYCIWCAVQYEDKTDLNENCPGPSAEDH